LPKATSIRNFFTHKKLRIHRNKPMRVLTFLNTSWHFTGYEASLWEWQGAWAKKPIFGSAYAATRGMLLLRREREKEEGNQRKWHGFQGKQSAKERENRGG
jgi:hypothetical protein